MLGKFNLANMVLDGVSRSISVNPKRCSRIKHKSSECTLCHMLCPADAIKVGGPGMTINVDWDKCTGCGICVNLCPTQTYSLRNGGYKNFIDNCCRAVSPDGSLTLVCDEADGAEAPGTATVECLGVINAVDILALYLRGARKITFQYGDCGECPSKSGRSVLAKEVEALKELCGLFEDTADMETEEKAGSLKVIFPKPRPIIRPKEEEKPNPVVDRRGLFAFLTNNAKETALKSASMMTPDKPEPRTIISFEKFFPQRRKIFLDCLMELGRLTSTEAATGKLFNNIEISPSCVFCGMCARFCPTGALVINDARTEIVFNPSKCVSCGLCEKACYHRKLKYKDTLSLKDLFSDVVLAKKEPR